MSSKVIVVASNNPVEHLKDTHIAEKVAHLLVHLGSTPSTVQLYSHDSENSDGHMETNQCIFECIKVTSVSATA